MGCSGSKAEVYAAPGPPGTAESVSPLAPLRASVQIHALRELDFEKVMFDEVGVERMIAFAAKEFAEENLLFWAAIQKFAAAVEAGADLEGEGAKIIDSFLCPSAETLVNLPSAMLSTFPKPSSQGAYEYKAGMFGDKTTGAAGEIYKLVRNDTFSRFKLSDDAESLLASRPHLADDDDDDDDEADAAVNSRASLRMSIRASRADGGVQASLKSQLRAWTSKLSCERITLWMIDQNSNSMFNISSTSLGNSSSNLLTLLT